MAFTEKQIRRYSRHIQLPEIGEQGQRKIRDAKVLCIGLGGLGTVASLYLANAGVGKLGLVDFDTVDLNNIQRQILYRTEDIGSFKAESAKKNLRAYNPDSEFLSFNEKLTEKNAKKLIWKFDIIVDGTDNFSSRYLINDTCAALKKPLVYGAAMGFEGRATTFVPKSPCYRCLHPKYDESLSVLDCAGGIFSPVAGIIGMIQASETLKLILGKPDLVGRLLVLDGKTMRFTEYRLNKNPACTACGGKARKSISR